MCCGTRVSTEVNFCTSTKVGIMSEQDCTFVEFRGIPGENTTLYFGRNSGSAGLTGMDPFKRIVL